MGQKIRIKLKSFDHMLLDKSAKKIAETVSSTGAKVCGPIPLPTSTKIFTVNALPSLTRSHVSSSNSILIADFWISTSLMLRQLILS